MQPGSQSRRPLSACRTVNDVNSTCGLGDYLFAAGCSAPKGGRTLNRASRATCDPTQLLPCADTDCTYANRQLLICNRTYAVLYSPDAVSHERLHQASAIADARVPRKNPPPNQGFERRRRFDIDVSECLAGDNPRIEVGRQDARFVQISTGLKDLATCAIRRDVHFAKRHRIPDAPFEGERLGKGRIRRAFPQRFGRTSDRHYKESSSADDQGRQKGRDKPN